MLGWIICRERNGAELEARMVWGVPFLVLETPAPRRRRDRRVLAAALREMARRGVRRTVVQGLEIPGLDAFGMTPVDPSALRAALLPQLLGWVDREWGLRLGSASVLLSADSSGADTWRAAVELSRRVRYVWLDTGPGQGALEEALRGRLGLGTGGGKAVLEVCLAERARTSLPQLHLGRGCGARQRLDVWAPQLPGAEESMLCAIFQAEKLPIQDIQVRFVEFRA